MAALNLTDEQQDKRFALHEANCKKNWDTMSSMRSEMFKLSTTCPWWMREDAE